MASLNPAWIRLSLTFKSFAHLTPSTWYIWRISKPGNADFIGAIRCCSDRALRLRVCVRSDVPEVLQETSSCLLADGARLTTPRLGIPAMGGGTTQNWIQIQSPRYRHHLPHLDMRWINRSPLPASGCSCVAETKPANFCLCWDGSYGLQTNKSVSRVDFGTNDNYC